MLLRPIGQSPRRSAREHGQTVDRAGWRLVGPMHIAETREQARKDVEWGFPPGGSIITAMLRPCRLRLTVLIRSRPWSIPGLPLSALPDDAVAQIERLIEVFGRIWSIPAPVRQLG